MVTSTKTKNVVYVFIDASNLWEAQKAKGKMFDYEKIKFGLVQSPQQNCPLEDSAGYLARHRGKLCCRRVGSADASLSLRIHPRPKKGEVFSAVTIKRFLKTMFTASEIEIFYYTAYPAEGTRNHSLDGKHKFFTYLKKGLGFTVRKKELKRIAIRSKEGDLIQEKGNMDVEMTIDIIHYMKKYNTALLFSGDSDFLALATYIKNGGKKIYIFSSKNNISQELRTAGSGYFDVLNLKEDIWGRELKYRVEV